MEKLVFILFIGLTFAIMSAFIASMKGRSVVAWSVCGFLTGLIGVIILIFLDDIREKKQLEEDLKNENQMLKNQINELKNNIDLSKDRPNR